MAKEPEHSDYSPSRLKRIIGCPASVNFINILMSNGKIKKEKKQSSYAADGSFKHKVVEKYYPNGPGERNPRALEVFNNRDDRLMIRDCADYADTIFAGIGHDNVYFSAETKVGLDLWGLPDVWGTLDYKIYDPIRRTIHIIDWKFGSGVMVHALKNPQLMAYAAGAVGWPSTIQKIVTHVVQPPLDHFDSYEFTIDELYEWVHGKLAIGINKTLTNLDEFNPGQEVCRWCEAKNHCPARIGLANDIAAELFEAHRRLQEVPSQEDLVALIKKSSLVETTIKGIKKFLINELQRGREIPGVKLVEGRSNRKWKSESDAIKWLADNTSIEELFNSKLLSPSQCEKELKSLKTNKDFMNLFHNPPGKVTLAYTEDKRPAIQPANKATEVFKDVSDIDIPE